jgi:hypothetical protein
MADNDLDIDPSTTGKALVVEFSIEKVIADWTLLQVDGDKTVQTWDGRTDDKIADVAAIDAVTLKKGQSLPWSIVLFGPKKAMKSLVTVEVRQDGDVLGTTELEVDLEAKKATVVSGTIHITGGGNA